MEKKQSRKSYIKNYLNNKEKIIEINKIYQENNKEKIELYKKKWANEKYDTFRLQCLIKLGCECKKCGNNDIRVLAIDHVNGGGVKELRNINSIKYYKKVLDDTENNYQILCHNCNWIKRWENGEIRISKLYYDYMKENNLIYMDEEMFCFQCDFEITPENNGLCINKDTPHEMYQCNDCHYARSSSIDSQN